MKASSDRPEAAPVIEEKVRRHLPLIAVFVLAVAYWLPVAPLGINLYDEGLRLYGADRILDGERPYRDFFASYGPGEYYWSALLFALFGKQLIVFRLGCLVAGGVVAVSLFSLGKHAGLATSWALLPVAGLLLPVTTGHHLYICGPALALALAGGAVITGSARPGRGRLFAAGALFGSAAVFRLDFGAFGAVAGGAAGFVVLRGAPGSEDHRSARRRAAGDLVFLLLGVGSVVLPAYAVFVLDDPYRLVHSLIVFPAAMLPYRHLAYLDPLRDVYWRIRGALANGLWLTLAHEATRATVFAVPPAFVLVLLGGLSLPSLRTRVLATPRRTATLVFVVVLALGLTSYALARFDFYHVLPLFVVSACGVAILVGSMLDRPHSRAVAVVGPVLVSAAGLALAGMHCVNVARAADYVPLGVERAAMIRIPPAGSAIAHAVADIGAAAAGRILIACTRHDRVHANPVALYFLSGRPSATYLHDFYPHVTTTRRAQERIVRDLRTHDVQTVLAWRCGLPEERNLSRTVRGVSILDDFLRAEFTAARRTDRYELLVKRGGDGVRRPE